MMKQFLVVGIAILCLQTTAGAQKNNPYNQRGLDYFKSLEVISSDFKAGKVTELTEESIAHYSAILPLQGTTTSEMASDIYKKLKSTKTSLTTEINNTTLAAIGKQAVLNVAFKYRQMSSTDYQNYLSAQCDVINSSDIPDSDKEFVLTVVAIAYNGSLHPAYARDPAYARNDDCIQTTEEGSGPAPCWLFGALLGGSLGYWACGVPCAIGGFIVGGIIGSLS